MAKYIDTGRLRAEIIRLRKDKPFHNDSSFLAYLHGLSRIEDFIDSLQQEQPEVDLERIIEQTYHDGSVADTDDMDHATYENIARYFFELGQKDAANKFDEIEYNRQRAEEEMSDKTLDEAADNFVWEVMENDKKGISDLCRKLRHSSKISDFYDALGEFFKAGAKWQKEQMMKEAVEVNVIATKCDDKYQQLLIADWNGFNNLLNADKVRIVVLKKEESK